MRKHCIHFLIDSVLVSIDFSKGTFDHVYQIVKETINSKIMATIYGCNSILTFVLLLITSLQLL